MKNATKNSNNLRWLWLSLFVLALDQGSKWLIQQHFALWQVWPIAPFFNIMLKHNAGAAFGFLSYAGGWQRWIFIGIAVLVSGFIIQWLMRSSRDENWAAAAFALVLGGAVGNLLDRFMLGYVIDFFDFYINDWHFATFNLADTAICIGAAMLILQSLLPNFCSQQSKSV